MIWAMIGRICVLAVLLTCAHGASAQIIYEPLRYQYGDDQKFYYGGGDPTIVAFGCSQFNSLPLTIYTDARPYENAAIYGYTTNDAKNQAYANAPRYFRMRDLIAAGVRSPDGTIIIPAQAQPVHPPAGITDSQSHFRMLQPILIIPHGQAVPPPPPSNNIKMTMN
jgi:hypothetical protein